MSLILSRLWGLKVNLNRFPERGNFSLMLKGADLPKRIKERIVVRSQSQGYLNFDLKPDYLHKLAYVSLIPKELKVSLDFLSCNPTGLPHLGNLFNGVQGDLLRILLEKSGSRRVHKVFCMNDRGIQLAKFKEAILNDLPGYTMPKSSRHLLGSQDWEDSVTRYWEPLIMKEAAKLGCFFDEVAYQSKLYRQEIVPLFRLAMPLMNLHDSKGKYLTVKGKRIYLVGTDGQMKYLTGDLCLQTSLCKAGYDINYLVIGSEQDNHVRRLQAVLKLLKVSMRLKPIYLSRLWTREKENSEVVTFSKRKGITEFHLPPALPMRFFLSSFNTVDKTNVISSSYVAQVNKEYQSVLSARQRLYRLPVSLESSNFNQLQRLVLGWLDSKFNALCKGEIHYVYRMLIRTSEFIHSVQSLSRHNVLSLCRLWADLRDFFPDL